MKLSILIPNWNGRDNIGLCLSSIFKHRPPFDFEVIVFDNGSTDGSKELIKDDFPQVKLIENKVNIGFTRAVNNMLRIAKGEYVAILNSDIYFYKDPFSPIISFMEKKRDVGVVGPALLKPDGTLHTTMGRHFPNIYSAFVEIFGIAPRLSRILPFYRLSSFIEPPIAHRKDMYTGHVEAAFMVVRKKVFDEFGYFDENFLLYYGDLDFQFRIRKRWKVYYMGSVKVYHIGGKALTSRSKTASFFYINNFLYYFKKNRTYIEFRLLYLIYLLKGKREVKRFLKEDLLMQQVRYLERL